MLPTIVLDATPLDTGHRTRGIGRYVQGLLEGFEAIRDQGALAIDLRLLRVPGGPGLAAPFPVVEYARRAMGSTTWMVLENLARIDRYLPAEAALYHGTSMEGVCRSRPWVATCHDLIPLLLRGPYLKPLNLSKRWFWSAYAKRLARKDGGLRRIIATSAHVKATLVERFGVEGDRIDVIHHGLSPFWSEPADEDAVHPRIREAAREGGPFVLFVGGFDPRKNLATLIRALGRLPAGLRPRLLLAGECERGIRWRHELMLRRCGVRGQFLHYVDDRDLRWLYSKAVCLAFPSHEEGWGFPIVEAMAVGTPVVCASWGSMVEAAGDAALAVDVRRGEEIASAVQRLVEDEALRAKHIAAGRRRAAELTWSAYAAQLQRVYLRALD